MASEKERFVTKQYVPQGQPISQNENTIIYKVKCLAEPGAPDGVLKIYRHKNIKALYTRLYQLNYSEWPHIYNVKYFDESTLVVEEFLNGSTMEERLEQNRLEGTVFSEEEAYLIMDKLCDCISQLTKPEPPIVHYNLKPSNIFLTTGGAIKLLDFVPGTSKKKPSHNIIKILGGIFHRMLTGKKPENGKCTYEGRYETVIRKCLEKNPEKRYENISDLKEDLDYAKTHEPDSVTRRKAEIPYVLTYPFQGFILAFEWLLISFFWRRNDITTMCLFVAAFVLHSIVFAVRRFTYLKKHNVHLSPVRKAIPVLAIILILACLSWILSFIV